jgi:hypothetical protein
MTNRKKAKQSLTRKQFEAIQSKLNKVLMESRITPLQAIHVLCIPMPLVQVVETSGSVGYRRSVSAWSAAGEPRAAR